MFGDYNEKVIVSVSHPFSRLPLCDVPLLVTVPLLGTVPLILALTTPTTAQLSADRQKAGQSTHVRHHSRSVQQPESLRCLTGINISQSDQHL